MNKQVNAGEKRMESLGELDGHKGPLARTEAEEDRGGRAQGNSGLLCLHTRHWEILKHIQSFTHRYTRGHAPAHSSTDRRLGGKPLPQLRPWLWKLIRALHLG